MTSQTHSFGYWLRRRRKALDLTQEALAAGVACSHFAIRKIEADERRPSKALAERLAARLGVPDAEREAFLAAARGLRGPDRLDLASLPQDDPTAASPPAAAAASGAARAAPEGVAAQRFVGRTAELAALEAAAARARAGAGQVVLLAGQPGIGKTRSAEALAERALARGMTVVWGRSPEQPGAPPYWPWVQLVRAFVEQREPRAVADALGAGAPWIAGIVPGLGVPGASAPAAPADAAQARFRLFDAMATFWRRAAEPDGLVLVLDDLHWADASSLRLLGFVAAESRAARLLVVGTYRDTEVGRHHPLTDTLGELARSPGHARLQLGGLSLDEARALVAGDATPEAAALERLHAQTEGNPLYLTEMARLLASPDATEGMVRRLPAGVRAAIGSRLNRLSASCNRVLALAAVIGRDFELPVLARVSDELDEDTCVAAIEEALRAGVVEELPETDAYRFAHALIRETLYDEIPAIRRPRLHHRVARALEEIHAADLEPQLSRLAHHFGASMSAQGAEQAVEYARRAGEHAMSLRAHEAAARRFRDALDALSVLERRSSPDLRARCELLVRQGEALACAADYASARDTLRAAADLAMACGSAGHLERAAIAFEDAGWRPGLAGDESIALLRAALERGGDDPSARARLLGSLTRALIFAGATGEAIGTSAQAVDAARRTDDPGILARALIAGLSARWEPTRIDRRLRDADEAIAIARRIGDADLVLEGSAWRLFDLMERGIDARFLRDLAEYGRAAEASRLPFHRYTAASFGPALALMTGDLAGSEAKADALMRLGEGRPGFDAAGVRATQLFTVRREQGRLPQLAPVVRHFVATTPDSARWRPGLALVLAEAGAIVEARREFDALAAAGFEDLPRDALWVLSVAYLAETCEKLGDRRRAPLLHRMLSPYGERNLLAGTSVACFGAASRFLGLLAATEGRLDDAIAHLRHAIEFNARQGAPTWVAHAQLQLARTLRRRARRADAEEADALLAQASSSARALGLVALARSVEASGGPAADGAAGAAAPRP